MITLPKRGNWPDVVTTPLMTLDYGELHVEEGEIPIFSFSLLLVAVSLLSFSSETQLSSSVRLTIPRLLFQKAICCGKF